MLNLGMLDLWISYLEMTIWVYFQNYLHLFLISWHMRYLN